MKNLEKLIENLTEHLDWALANEWETPITLSDDIEKAIEILEYFEDINTWIVYVREFFKLHANSKPEEEERLDGELKGIIAVYDHLREGVEQICQNISE